MSTTKQYRTVYAIGRPGGKTVLAGKPIELTDQEAERLLENGVIEAMENASQAPTAMDSTQLQERPVKATRAAAKKPNA